MRISDWSSDVCSSDLFGNRRLFLARFGGAGLFLAKRLGARGLLTATRILKRGKAGFRGLAQQPGLTRLARHQAVGLARQRRGGLRADARRVGTEGGGPGTPRGRPTP